MGSWTFAAITTAGIGGFIAGLTCVIGGLSTLSAGDTDANMASVVGLGSALVVISILLVVVCLAWRNRN